MAAPTSNPRAVALIAQHDALQERDDYIRWLDRVVEAEALDTGSRDDWLIEMTARLERGVPATQVGDPLSITQDPLLKRVVGELIGSDDPVVRYAAARCLLADRPDAQAGLDMAAYWLGDSVLHFRGPRSERGLVRLAPPEAMVVLLLGLERYEAGWAGRETNASGLTPEEQGAGLIDLAGTTFGRYDLTPAQLHLVMGIALHLDSPFADLPRENPLAWLPEAAPPYQPSFDPRARGLDDPMVLDEQNATLFDRLAGAIDAPGENAEAWSVLLRLGSDKAPDAWQQRVRSIVVSHGTGAIPAMVEHGGSFRDQALFVEAVIALGPESIPVLASLLDHEDPAARAAAARGLAAWGENARPAVPSLRQVARQDPDDYARFQAYRALAEIDP
ncbi:MAG: hypothetical protein GVY24_05525 [Planctomycetes bacterium]|nr:hypothetical protein [Planctomycetota bacterium]